MESRRWYLQSFLLLLRDVGMDAGILLTTQLCFGRIDFRRFLSALICMQLFTLSYILFGENVRQPVWIAIELFAAAFLLSSGRPIRKFFANAAVILLCSIAAAGLMTLLKSGIYAYLALLMTLCLLRTRMHIRFRWNIDVKVESRGQTACFNTLIDTGNRLREPFSGLPVLIVSEDALPEHFFSDKRSRSLPYGVLGNAGEINIFRAEKIHISQFGGKDHIAPPCYIGVFSGKIPGNIQALAPPEFTEALHPTVIRYLKVRRNRHVVLKHQAINLWTRSANSKRLRLLHRRKRSASATADTRRRNIAGVQGQCRRYERSIYDD